MLSFRVNPLRYKNRPNSYIITTLMVDADMSVEDAANGINCSASTFQTKLYRDQWSMEDFIRFLHFCIKTKLDNGGTFEIDLNTVMDIYNNTEREKK